MTLPRQPYQDVIDAYGEEFRGIIISAYSIQQAKATLADPSTVEDSGDDNVEDAIDARMLLEDCTEELVDSAIELFPFTFDKEDATADK